MKKTHKERHLRLPVKLDEELEAERERLHLSWNAYAVMKLTERKRPLTKEQIEFAQAIAYQNIKVDNQKP